MLSLGLYAPASVSVVAFPLVGLFASVMWPILISLAHNSVAEHQHQQRRRDGARADPCKCDEDSDDEPDQVFQAFILRCLSLSLPRRLDVNAALHLAPGPTPGPRISRIERQRSARLASNR